MSSQPFEQRNPYKGDAAAALGTAALRGQGGTREELELVADTGNPFVIVLSVAAMMRLQHTAGHDVNTNFGLLQGGWLKLVMPELGLDLSVEGYASDVVFAAVQRSSPDFQGLVGLPLLRLVEYGGDADSFWIRKAP
jgi:hypothetical protein